MNSSFKDREISTKILTEQCLDPLDVDHFRSNPLLINELLTTISYDCTPNWGISGTKDIGEVLTSGSQNRYLECSNHKEKGLIQKRINNININEFKKIIKNVVVDMFGVKSQIAGFGLYGSYVYGPQSMIPDDLDILIILANDNISVDAEKYPVAEINKIFIDRRFRSCNSINLGLTIISKNFFDKDGSGSRNFVVTDAALLDMSTVYGVGLKVVGNKIPDFVLNQNMQKLIYWGKTGLGEGGNTVIKRTTEALIMRKYLMKNNGLLGLGEAEEEIDFSRGFNECSSNDEILLAQMVTRLLKNDEIIIRKNIIKKANLIYNIL